MKSHPKTCANQTTKKNNQAIAESQVGKPWSVWLRLPIQRPSWADRSPGHRWQSTVPMQLLSASWRQKRSGSFNEESRPSKIHRMWYNGKTGQKTCTYTWDVTSVLFSTWLVSKPAGYKVLPQGFIILTCGFDNHNERHKFGWSLRVVVSNMSVASKPNRIFIDKSLWSHGHWTVQALQLEHRVRTSFCKRLGV